MEIKELINKSYENSKLHGFWDNYKREERKACSNINDDISSDNADAYISQKLMLIVSEIAEAQEGLGKNNYDNFKEEMADCFIRLADLCGGLEIDIETEIINKLEINSKRPYKHNKKF